MRAPIRVFITIVLSACLTQFASEIYAPSLPAIAKALQAPLEYVQWSMSIYMLGVTLSQLIYGPLSEGIGRRLPLVGGLTIMAVGSLICVASNSIEGIWSGRFIQGVGAGAGAALWRSVFRDIYSGEELAKYGSYLVIFIMFIVPAAPALGGYFQEYWGWQANFIFMAVYSVVTLLAFLYGFKETNQYHHRERLKWDYIIKTYHLLLSNKIFIGITASTFLCYGALFSWFTVGPILFIEGAGLNPVEFGWLSCLGGGFTYALAGILNGKLVGRFGMPWMMRIGFSIMLFSGILLLLSTFWCGLHAFSIAVPGLLFYFGSTFIWPNAFATAFTPFGKIAGYAGALYGFMQISGAAIISGLMAYLPAVSQAPLGAVFALCTACAWLIYEFSIKKGTHT